jgi:hypothetical protein
MRAKGLVGWKVVLLMREYITFFSRLPNALKMDNRY